MLLKRRCCSTKDNEPTTTGVSVKVIVDVPRIVKSLCRTGVLIVGIIFGSKTFQKMLEDGFFNTKK